MPKQPTLAEVNQEIRKIKRQMRGNNDVLAGLMMIDAKNEFIEEVTKMIEHQKEVINCLNCIREKLL